MSKEERYSHLGDGPGENGTDEAGGDAGGSTSGIRVTIDDGDEEVVLTVDPEVASVADLREAIRTARDETGGPPTPLALGVRSAVLAQQMALTAGVLGPVAAANRAALLACRNANSDRRSNED